jgi:hypothetical protein
LWSFVADTGNGDRRGREKSEERRETEPPGQGPREETVARGNKDVHRDT